jgi:SAM-dependent methyltransferase
MTQNIYDDPEFYAGYSQLERSIHGLAGAPEWPVIEQLLPQLGGKRVVDLGCGFGWFCRFALERGAAKVLGVDVSEKMISRARETSASSIEYRRADLETFTLPEASHDLVYSSLAFHYVEDLPSIFAVAHRALVPAGDFVFSMEHPIYMAPEHPGWLLCERGTKIWPLSHYAEEGPRTTNWLARAVVKHHRMLSTTLNMLICSGFILCRLEEFAPTQEQIAANPVLAEERHRPMFLIVKAQRAHGNNSCSAHSA